MYIAVAAAAAVLSKKMLVYELFSRFIFGVF
jgi:hypothetical protein